MAKKRFEGVSFEHEVQLDEQLVDIRTLPQKILDFLGQNNTFFIYLLWIMLAIMILLPFTIDYMLFLVAVTVLSASAIGKRVKFSFIDKIDEKVMLSTGPRSMGTHNRKEDKWYDENGNVLNGIYLFGNDLERNNKEIWLTDNQVRTHMLLFGTTGAGKSEALLSLCYGALLTCSGFIYSDGKGTFELFHKIYNTCRKLGQEDDVLLISFLTGKEDVRKPTTQKISNELNPFASATQEAATQMLVSLMATNGSGGGDIWTERAAVLMESIMGLLTFRREHHKNLIDVNAIRDMLILNNMYQAYNNAKGITDKDNPAYLEDWVIQSLKGYLVSLPGFDESKPFEEQPDTINEQHGYLQMQFTKLLGSLADMYGYIFDTQLSEINFWDVVVNRRVLVVLLPALAKSKSELSMLGKIIIACIKQMMTSGLGATAEGVVGVMQKSNPTKSESAFITILDEYGYYSVAGAAVMPAQARSLGFFMIFAGQDFPAFTQGGKEEAQAIVANCNLQVCMKLQDQEETFKIFEEKAGRVRVAVSGGKQFKDNGDLINSQSVQYEERSRITFKDLAGQTSGEGHFFFGKEMVRGRFFYAKIDLLDDNLIRINQFVQVAPPDEETVKSILDGFKEISDKITNVAYIESLMASENEDNSVSQVIEVISQLFSDYKQQHTSSDFAACATIAHVMYNNKKYLDEEKSKHNIKTSDSQTSFFKNDKVFEELESLKRKEREDINNVVVNQYGQKESKARDEAMKRSSMLMNNMRANKNEVDKTMEHINNITAYPYDTVEPKKEKDFTEFIRSLDETYNREASKLHDRSNPID